MRRSFLLSILLTLAFVTGIQAQSTEPTTPYVGTTDATAATSTSAELHGGVLARGLATTAWFEWGTTTSSLGNQTEGRSVGNGTTPVTFAQSISNLQPHTAYYFRIVARNDAGTMRGEIRTFTTLSSSSGPTVATRDATSVTSSAAVLNGSVNPLGSATTVWFSWGTTSTHMNQSDPQNVGAGLDSVTFRQSLSNLEPHTTYYFLAMARSAAGVVVYGEPRSFTTSSSTVSSNGPSVQTNEAADVTSSGAVLNGIINPNGNPAGAWFEWGTTTALSNRSDVQMIASGTNTVAFRQSLTNLQARTTYYFRAVGYNSGATVRGEIRSFTTASSTTSSEGPSVGTTEATAITSTSAELHGVINSADPAIKVWFEWGNTSPLAGQTNSRGLEGDANYSRFAQTISSLQPNTNYYFRAVAQVGTNVVRGNVRSFTTARVVTEAPRSIPEVEQGEIKSGYVVITPDTGSAAAAPLATYGTVNGGIVQSQAGIFPAALTTEASMFVEVIPTISRNIGVAIVNAGTGTTAITITLRAEDGSIVGSPSTVSVPPRHQVAQFIHELFGSEAIGAGFRGSLRLQGTAPFAALGLRFAGNVFSTLPVTVITPAPGATSLILPQFAIAGGWATHIALVNNANAAIAGRVEIFDASGNPMPVKLNGETKSSFSYSIPIGGTFVLAPRDSNGQSAL